MKIVQILPELNSGGVEKGTLEISKYLVSQGHDSWVISAGGRLLDPLRKQGGKHIQMPVHRKHVSSLKQIKLLRELFEREQFDIIHVRSRVPAWLAYLAWKKMDKSKRPKFLATAHGTYSINAYSAIMTKAEQVIAVSEHVKTYLLNNYKIAAKKIQVIHRGVDANQVRKDSKFNQAWLQEWYEQFPQTKDKTLLLLPGRLTRWKGQQDLLHIIAKLKADYPQIHGVIVGEVHPRKQAFKQELQEQIEELGLQGDISFTGHRSDVAKIMQLSDIILSLSKEPEAFGRVSLEGLALAKPVLGYAHGGVAEQLAALYPQGAIEPNNIEEAVIRLSQWLSQGAPAVGASIEPFTLQKMQQMTLEVYENLLDHAE